MFFSGTSMFYNGCWLMCVGIRYCQLIASQEKSNSKEDTRSAKMVPGLNLDQKVKVCSEDNFSAGTTIFWVCIFRFQFAISMHCVWNSLVLMLQSYLIGSIGSKGFTIALSHKYFYQPE